MPSSRLSWRVVLLQMSVILLAPSKRTKIKYGTMRTSVSGYNNYELRTACQGNDNASKSRWHVNVVLTTQIGYDSHMIDRDLNGMKVNSRRDSILMLGRILIVIVEFRVRMYVMNLNIYSDVTTNGYTFF